METSPKVKMYANGRIIQGGQDAARCLCDMTGLWREYRLGGVIGTAWEVTVPYDPLLAQLRIPVEESIPTDPYLFDAAVGFYRAVRKVFVHCAAGQNRSMATTAALLVGAEKIPVEKALELTNPNLPPALLGSFEKWARGKL